MDLKDFFFYIGIFVLIRAAYLFYQWIICYFGADVNVKEEFHTNWAVITGANSGLGKSLAIRLAKQGVNVIGTGRRLELLEAVKKECEAFGTEFVCVQADHSDPESVTKVMDACGDKDIGLCVINAGRGIFCHVKNMKDDEISKFIHLMCTQYSLLAKEFIGRNKDRKEKSCIYMTASLAADSLAPAGSLYCSVKSYVSRMAKHLAMETAGTNIAVTAMHPGFFGGSGFFNGLPKWMEVVFTMKGLFPVGEDVANAVMKTFGKCDRVDFAANSLWTRCFCWALGEFPQYIASRFFMKIFSSKKPKTE